MAYTWNVHRLNTSTFSISAHHYCKSFGASLL